MEYVYRKSSKILKELKKVFGDLVVEAYAVSCDYGDDKYTESHLKQTITDFTSKDYSGLRVAAKFSNGKIVMFWNSEWAGMELVEGDIKEF